MISECSNGTLQVQFLQERERGRNSTKVSTKRGASLGPRLRGTLTRRCFQLVPMKLPFYYCSICSRKLLSYSVEKLSRIIETRRCYTIASEVLVVLAICACNFVSLVFYSLMCYVARALSNSYFSLSNISQLSRI